MVDVAQLAERRSVTPDVVGSIPTIYPMRKLLRGIRNLIYWFPIIWNDYDWDYHSIFEILHYKLTAMEKCIREHGIALDTDATVHKIKVARILTKRLVDLDHLERALAPCELKWGKRSVDWNKANLEFTYEKAHTDEEIAQADKDFLRAGRRSDVQEKADIDYLFRHMVRHIERWWD